MHKMTIGGLLKNARLSLTESMMDINLEHDAAGSDLTGSFRKIYADNPKL